ncbi:MAG: RecT family recombinase [Candidatus Thiodiazotropha endolucinida]
MQTAMIQPTENTEIIPGTADFLFVDGMMERLERFAQMMAKSKATIPNHLVNSPADCMAVVMQAAQWKMNPFAVAQKTHLVNGTLGYEAQLVNAVINSIAPTQDRLNYEWYGPWENVIGKFKEKSGRNNSTYLAPDWSHEDEKGCGVRVWATLKGENKPRELDLLLSQATVRNSTLWASDPKQQLAYLAVKRWSRLYTPDVIMGVYTADELGSRAPTKDMGEAVVVDAEKDGTRTDSVKSKLSDNSGAETPSLESITTAIKSAVSKADLDKAVAQASMLDDASKKKARSAYTKRMKEIKAKDQPKQTDEPTPTSGGPSYAEIADKINKATNSDDVDVAIDLTNSIADLGQREELLHMAEEKLNGMGDPA